MLNKLKYPNLYEIERKKEQHKTLEEFNKTHWLYIDSLEDRNINGLCSGEREFKTVNLDTVTVLKILAFRNPNITIKE